MGEALYRKYRSKSLDEIVGQEHITTTLKNAIKKGKISHAYLFTGPKGVGKTSIARILAYTINGLDYNESNQHHLDIIEIDAASNRRIDEIRELRDKVHVAPSMAKYKVYIIDEVHMLTKEAFNALLKTLEEPPEHVIFILATTEAHKLPETIISRTQRFSFKPISNIQAVEHLRSLADKEKIDINDEALELIAEHGAGSFRDSISLLDQVSSLTQKVTAEQIQTMIGVPSQTAVVELFASLSGGDATAVIEKLTELYNQGYQAAPIAKELSKLVRQTLIEQKNTPSSYLELAKQLINVPSSYDPEVYLELTLVETTLLGQPATNPITEPAKPKPAKEVVQQPEIPAEVIQEQPIAKEETTSPKPSTALKGTKDLQKLLDAGLWEQMLSTLKGSFNTLYGIVRMAEPRADDNNLVLEFKFAFHQRRCDEPRNRDRIATVIQDITGQAIQIVCTVNTATATKEDNGAVKTDKSSKKSATLESITEVFGGGEILE